MTLPHAHVSDVTLARVMPGRMEQFVSGHYAEGLGEIYSKAVLLDESENGSQSKQLSVALV
jgi:hypothetical protein